MNILQCVLLMLGLLRASGWSLADSSLKFKILDLDAAKPVNIETVAESLCARNSDQIARISTFRNLLPYMRKARDSGDQSLRECARKYSAILDQMDQLIQPTADGTCAMQYVDKISNFIDSFIGRLSSDRKRRRNKKHPDEAPPMLANFFLHYVSEVSITCREVMIENMSYTLPSRPVDLIKTHIYLGNLGELFSDDGSNKISLVTGDWLTSSKRIRGRMPYMGELSELMKAIQPKPEVDHYVMFVKVQGGKYFYQLQKVCETDFRPTYRAIILPLERLKNLGFSGRHNFESKIDANTIRTIRNWYRVAQTCESIRPIALVEDKDMDWDKSLVITRREAERSPEFDLRRQEVKKLANKKPSHWVIEKTGPRDDLLRTVQWENTKDMSKVVKDFAKKRDVHVFDSLTLTYAKVSSRINGIQDKFVLSMSVTGKKDYPLKFKFRQELEVMNSWYKKLKYYMVKPIQLLGTILLECITYAVLAIGAMIFGAILGAVLFLRGGW